MADLCQRLAVILAVCDPELRRELLTLIHTVVSRAAQPPGQMDPEIMAWAQPAIHRRRYHPRT